MPMLSRKNLADTSIEDNFVSSLPGDASGDLRSRQVPNVCYSFTTPTKVKHPKIIAWSDELASTLGLNRPKDDDQETADILAGNQCIPGMRPYAARYGGHQFGHWAGQLGDGRAMTLGELRDQKGNIWEMQLKGAGPTPYSRRADGRAVLRSSLREFLCSEAMFHLGVPTTRALSLTLTGDLVTRDMLYDGNPDDELGAIVCRMAPSFLRFGSFEILTASDEPALLQKLVDWTITHHFQHLGQLKTDDNTHNADVYGSWFVDVAVRTAKMIIEWLRVGFVHGVMNTDNMSILGLTIDYGPYGWLEDFNPRWTPNTTDRGLRYCFAAQPQVALWNLQCLATALKPLFDKSHCTDSLEEGMQAFIQTFQVGYKTMFLQKLGLNETDAERDDALVLATTELLQSAEIDMTVFFRQLAKMPLGQGVVGHEQDFFNIVRPAYYKPSELSGKHEEGLVAWLMQYEQTFRSQSASHSGDLLRRVQQMNRVNPKYVLRNYLAQEAIDLATDGDYSRIHILQEVLKLPYDEQPERDMFAEKRPEWARHKVGCSALSCSS